jgi:ribosomal protein S18 acetylase RimI-like enzyme
MNTIIREINKEEYPLLENFMYEAIFIPQNTKKPEREVLQIPKIAQYYTNFGQKHDECLIAEINQQAIGAVWIRLFTGQEHGYGFIDTQTPEICMSVLPQYRKKGIGTKLFTAMLNKLIALKYQKVSLSVDTDNYAMKMYQKFGFSIISHDDQSAVMVKFLNRQ